MHTEAGNDRILIRELLLRATVGPTAPERREPQHLTVSIALDADLSRAAATDDLADTIDYSRLKKQILASVERRSFRTLERIAQRIADICLSDPRIGKAFVQVEQDPGMTPAGGRGVRIERSRSAPVRRKPRRPA